MLEGCVSVGNCQADLRNVEGGLGTKKTSSMFSKPKISWKNNAPDMAQSTGLQSAMMVIGKCGKEIYITNFTNLYQVTAVT
jgi:hypothetical protein